MRRSSARHEKCPERPRDGSLAPLERNLKLCARNHPPAGPHRRRVISEKTNKTAKSRQSPNYFLPLWMAFPLDPEVRRALVRSARRVTESVHLLAPAEALGRGRHLAPPLADLHRGTRRARAIAVGDGVHRRRGLLHRLSAGPAGMPYASALAPRVDGTDQGSHRSPPGGPGRSRQRAGVRERAAGSAGLMTRLPWADQPRK